MRNSDRWITPGVVIVVVLTGGALVALLITAVAWLSARGVDPDPMVKTVGALVAGAGSLGTLLLQLASRQTVAKTERNTGVLANALHDVADVLDTVRPTPGGPVTQMAGPPPVPPARSRHAYPETGAAPAVRE